MSDPQIEKLLNVQTYDIKLQKMSWTCPAYLKRGLSGEDRVRARLH